MDVSLIGKSYISKLPIELYAPLFEAFLYAIGPIKILRIRAVCKLWNEEILRAFCHSFLYGRMGPVHILLSALHESRHGQTLSIPIMGRLIHAQFLSMTRLDLGSEESYDSFNFEVVGQGAFRLPGSQGSHLAYSGDNNNVDEYSASDKPTPNPQVDILSPIREAIEHVFQNSLQNEEQRPKITRHVCEALADRLNISFDPGFTFKLKLDPIPNENEHLQNVFSIAIIAEDTSLMKSLMSTTPSTYINTDNRYFGKPLQLAASLGCWEVIKLLLDNGADLKFKQQQDRIQPSSIEIMRRLVYFQKTKALSTFDTAFEVACAAGHIDTVRNLFYPIQTVLPVPRLVLSPFFAIMNGQETTAMYLLQELSSREYSTFYPSRYKECIYHLACYTGCQRVVEFMLQSGVDVNAVVRKRDDRVLSTALQLAAIHGHSSIIRLLLRNGAVVFDNVDDLYFTSPEAIAAERGHKETLQILLDAFCKDPEATIRCGIAFVAAVTAGDVHIVRLFLDQGLDLNLSHKLSDSGDITTIGQYALNCAVAFRMISSVRILAEAGVPLNHEDSTWDPVVTARIFSAKSSLNTLLGYGAHNKEIPITYDYVKSRQNIPRYPTYALLPSNLITSPWIGKY